MAHDKNVSASTVVVDDADSDYPQADELPFDADEDALKGYVAEAPANEKVVRTPAETSAASALTTEERAELERLRAEKAARERRELEALREEQRQANMRAAAVSRRSTNGQPHAGERRSSQQRHVSNDISDEERQRIVESRARGERLMMPDEETLAMPVGQRVVLAVIGLATVVALILLLAPTR